MNTQAPQMNTVLKAQELEKPNFDAHRNYGDEDVSMFMQALKDSQKKDAQKPSEEKKADKADKADKAEKKENQDDEKRTQGTAHLNERQYTELQMGDKMLGEGAKAELSSQVNESKLLDSISKVVELVRVESAKLATETLASKQELVIKVKNEILPKTEIRLSDLGNQKIQVQMNMNDVRSVQIVAQYRDRLQEQLGDNFVFNFNDLTAGMDTHDNPDHESAMKQQMQNEEDEVA